MTGNRKLAPEDRFLIFLDNLKKLEPESPPSIMAEFSPPQILMLNWIAKNPGCSVHEAAEGLDLTPPTVSVSVHRLQKQGFLTLKQNPKDGRALMLSLTPSGRKHFKNIESYRRKKARIIINALKPEQRVYLLSLLEKAINHAQAKKKRIINDWRKL